MTKLAATFLLLFFVVVSSSHARDLTDRSEYEVPVSDSAEESNSKPSIEKFTTDLDPSEITAFDATETGSDPEFLLSFRQIGRRSVPLQGRRGCHHRHHFKRWRSYGNDMIVSEERSRPSSVASWGRDREIAELGGEWKEDRKHFHHFHHHGEEEEEEHKHKEKSGFLRSFRKFLKQLEL